MSEQFPLKGAERAVAAVTPLRDIPKRPPYGPLPGQEWVLAFVPARAGWLWIQMEEVLHERAESSRPGAWTPSVNQ